MKTDILAMLVGIIYEATVSPFSSLLISMLGDMDTEGSGIV